MVQGVLLLKGRAVWGDYRTSTAETWACEMLDKISKLQGFFSKSYI